MAAWPDLKGQRIGQALFGALLHEQYIVTEDRSNAERADFHYLVALALMGQNVRFKAMILGELGILHADVGNYRIGLGYLLERDKLPYVDNAEGLDVHLSLSETLLHVGREDEAAKQAELAIQLLERNPNLARYRLLALDWAALTNLAAKHFDRALALYNEEIPAIEAEGAGIPERARVVTRLARAAAAVGAGASEAALADMDVVATRLQEPRAREELRWPHATIERTAETYRLIVSGLRARAYHRLGRLPEEAAALESRLGVLEAQFVASTRAEVLQDELFTAAALAINAAARQDEHAATRWLGRAISLADDLRAREPEDSLRGAVDIALLAAHLSVSMRVAVVPDLAGRLDRLATDLTHHPDPDLAAQRRWIEVYLPLVAGSSPPVLASIPALPSNP
jgi:hypothetical protein